jgi:hypothetical protein
MLSDMFRKGSNQDDAFNHRLEELTFLDGAVILVKERDDANKVEHR